MCGRKRLCSNLTLRTTTGTAFDLAAGFTRLVATFNEALLGLWLAQNGPKEDYKISFPTVDCRCLCLPTNILCLPANIGAVCNLYLDRHTLATQSFLDCTQISSTAALTLYKTFANAKSFSLETTALPAEGISGLVGFAVH